MWGHMSVVVIRCPTTGRTISTGIETDQSTFDKLPDVRTHSRCPLCGFEHFWWKREAWLADIAPSAKRI
jgi:hypothetical protein